MDNETLNNIRAFMMRVDLKGHEVPAYYAAMNALDTLDTTGDEKNLPYVGRDDD